MSIAISDALQQAQQDIEGGDYRSAIQTCNQLVNQFPDYAAAYRVLGEAYLEQGQPAEAEQAFAQALLRDPRQAWAYHGLGLIAEEQNVLENALAFCQVAWELAPNHARLRDPVLRIATRRFGTEGQAQLTSAALAQIYSNTSRLQRAATEYRAALAELPDRVDLKLGLAETLWQLGADEEAADLVREVLEENPIAIQALVILADIEGRAGNDSESADLRGRIRAIDPDGSIAATMLARNERADHELLLLSPDAMPVMDEKAEAVVAERPHIAPAPDFSYQPSSADQPVQDIEDLEPISAEEFGTDAPLADMDTVEPELVASDTAGVQDDAPSIYRDDDDVAFSGLEQELAAEELVQEFAAVDEPVDDDFEALLAEFGDVEPMGIEEFGAEPEDLERLAAAESDLLAGDDLFSDLAAPFPSDGDADDHVRTLTSALEDDVAEVLDRTGEFQTVDAAAEETGLQEETEVEAEPDVDLEVAATSEPEQEPDPLSGTGYTTVLHELDDAGLTPFDPLSRPDPQDMPSDSLAAEDIHGDDAGDSAVTDELAKLTQDWDSIDDEIARAVPLTTGHTDQLRAADDLGIDPFDFEIEDDTSRLPAYRPFGEDDDELPELEAEETGDVDSTLQAETEPAGAEEQPLETDLTAAETEAEVEDSAFIEEAQEAEAATEPEDVPVEETAEDLLADLEPFSLEEIEDDEGESTPFAFGSLPWETTSTGSAVPSDEDLDLLLGPDDAAQQPEPDVPSIEPDWPTRALDTSETESHDQVDWMTAIQDPVDATAADDTGSEAEQPAEDLTTAWDIPSDWDASLAVTRHIGGDSDDIAEQVAEAEADAQPDTEWTEPQTSGLGGVDPDQLVADYDLFDRTRSAKTDLISQGAISGDRSFELQDAEPELLAEAEETEQASTWAEEAVVEEEEFEFSTGATRDVNTLRASLEAAPDDDELHWWLAEALREEGDIEEAYVEYRWLIRNAGHRADDVIDALSACIEQEQYAEMGHRLLADIYRRRGAVSLASQHAASAMAVRRRLRS